MIITFPNKAYNPFIEKNMVKEFKVLSDFKPAGDQPKAIKELVEGVNNGLLNQTLLGVTGSVSYTHLTLPTKA